MSNTILDRAAQTEHPVLDVLAERWSPRAYDAETPIDEAKLASALEAARWSPSAANSQPWRFIVARRGSAAHHGIHSTLMGLNQAWAGDAGVLIVAIAEVADVNGAPISHAIYDLGQAVAHLSVQAHHDGLHVHQMSGFVADQLRDTFGLDERFVPMTVLALGDLGDAAQLPEPLREREVAPRTRRPMAETLLVDA